MGSLSQHRCFRSTSALAMGIEQALEKRTFPTGICANPRKYLLMHYNGDVSFCCEYMYRELLKSNIFNKSIMEICSWSNINR